jgi:type VI secretion system protein ImpE
MKKNDTLPATLSALLHEHSLVDGLQMAEQRVRIHPAQVACRHSLFQLLCIMGEWSRAMQQLQLCARMDANYIQEAQLFGELIRCEMFRQSCLQGKQRPGFILPPPTWMEDLLSALMHNARGETAEADVCRSKALEAMTDVGGQWNDSGFDWISDSDSRIGPVVELVSGGIYTWLPFSQIRLLGSSSPNQLTDLCWKPVTITLVNGVTYGAWLFTRYSGSEDAADALRLCRETVWQDGPGDTVVQALGQKMWLTSHGDKSLLELTDCSFYTPIEGDA